MAGVVILHDAGRDRWLKFEAPRSVLCARRLDEVVPHLQRIDRETAENGRYAAGFIAYEAGSAFDPAIRTKIDPEFPLLWFGLYDAPEEIEIGARRERGSENEENKQNEEKEEEGEWQPEIGPDEYLRRFAAIQELIRSGDTYQVNFTYRLRRRLRADPWQIFLQLVAAQSQSYSAFIDAGEWVVCSASPELFFLLEGSRIESRPMKGTAPRGLWFEQDRENGERLQRSEKDRAENVMIVDMVRNDFGRIAAPGTVAVPALFRVERYPTVWQLTSTVTAETDAPIDRIFAALFPPASVTGTPKLRTTEIIETLERSPRRVYTGSIGFVEPGRRRRAQFNVAIRTLLVEPSSRQAEYGVGGGVIADSVGESELAECQLKARILHTKRIDFDLLETMRWEPPGSDVAGYFLLDLHLERLARSAEYFSFNLDLTLVQAELARVAAGLSGVTHRVRVLVSKSGHVNIAARPLGDAERVFEDIALAPAPIDATDPFLYHKTTRRDAYQAALKSMKSLGARPLDALLQNERGEITESTLANVAVELEGRVWTPPVRCGLLPGTYRAWLLKQGRVNERVISVDEALTSSAIYLMNSVRGMHRIRIQQTSGSGLQASGSPTSEA